uniref:Alpha-L-fucosidase C-terminal domain-containing protein n=1 Tax=Anguilla anguilla TaxID=7936 RepID=A0A0E9Y128_ANGAN
MEGQSENSTQTVWYTSKGSQVYAFFLVRPSESWLKLAEPITSPSTKVTLLGYSGQLSWSALQPSGLTVQLPLEPFVNGHGWTLRLDGVK